MLDFRRNSKASNYLGPKEQRRLVLLLALAAVIVILVFRARNPDHGGWFAGNGATDNRLQSEQPAAAGPATAEDRRAAGADNGVGAARDRNALFPGVRADYLTAVEDDSVFRDEEANAWFHLLALLEATDERELERASLGRVSYLQLDQQSAAYRGRLVTLAGIVRGAKLVPAPQNDFGIKQYYQLWLQPERGAPELAVVYALALPAGFPLGTQLDAPCTTTGFYFKRWAYRAQAGVVTAPLVLARWVDWRPPPAPKPEAPLGEQIVWSIGVALVAAVLIVGFLAARGRAALRRRPLPASAERLAEVLASHAGAVRTDLEDTRGDES